MGSWHDYNAKNHKILAPEGGAKNYTLPGGCTHEMLGWERKIENSENNMKTTLCAKLPKITLQPEFFLQVPCLWTCMSVGSNRNPSGLTWVAGKSSIFRGASWKLNTPNTVAQWCGSWLQNGVRCQTKKKPPELVSLECSYTIHFWRTNLLS